jgi:hypothetical protein
MEQKSKHLVCTWKIQSGARAVTIPHDVPARAKLEVLRVIYSESPTGLDTVEIEGKYDSERVVVYPTLRTFGDCFAGERVLVEAEFGWIDGTVQDKE